MQREAVRELDRGANDRRGILIGHHAPNEGLVDLDAVHGHALQIRQTRVSRAKVVDQKLHSETLQFAQRLDDAFRIIHQGTFGDFELHPIRMNAPGGEQAAYPIEEPRIAKVAYRQVDSERLLEALFVPRVSLAERRLEHPRG